MEVKTSTGHGNNIRVDLEMWQGSIGWVRVLQGELYYIIINRICSHFSLTTESKKKKKDALPAPAHVSQTFSEWLVNTVEHLTVKSKVEKYYRALVQEVKWNQSCVCVCIP